MNDTAELGRYADHRTYPLPRGWTPVSTDTLELAAEQAVQALETPAAVDRLLGYYDPASDYAGTTFLDVRPNDPDTVGAADLWAVSTLSMPTYVRQGRQLIDDPDVHRNVTRLLRSIDADLPLSDLEHADHPYDDATPADVPEERPLLDRMLELQSRFRTLLATAEKSSNHWVFAAKLCARKRPLLFPVRDNLVCAYLAGGKPLGAAPGQLGRFRPDIQVYAYLITHPDVRHGLDAIRGAVTEDGVRVDEPPLRLLDAVLWTQARWAA